MRLQRCDWARVTPCRTDISDNPRLRVVPVLGTVIIRRLIKWAVMRLEGSRSPICAWHMARGWAKILSKKLDI
ncbi:hypothetical protein PCAR4_570183 [Paraburkholderia caribensis]|nr:hypothetical protein PCAR4_570183 [Paraburkholderia caribensis]